MPSQAFIVNLFKPFWSFIVKINYGLNKVGGIAPTMNTGKRIGASSFLGEFFMIFIAIVFALALVGVIQSFSSTASANANDPNVATLYGLVPLFIALVILIAVGAVAYREVNKMTHKGRAFDSTPSLSVTGRFSFPTIHFQY